MTVMILVIRLLPMMPVALYFFRQDAMPMPGSCSSPYPAIRLFMSAPSFMKASSSWLHSSIRDTMPDMDIRVSSL